MLWIGKLTIENCLGVEWFFSHFVTFFILETWFSDDLHCSVKWFDSLILKISCNPNDSMLLYDTSN